MQKYYWPGTRGSWILVQGHLWGPWRNIDISEKYSPLYILSWPLFFAKKYNIGHFCHKNTKYGIFVAKNINISAPRTNFGGNYAYFWPIWRPENIVKISRYIASYWNIVKYRLYRKKTVLLKGAWNANKCEIGAVINEIPQCNALKSLEFKQKWDGCKHHQAPHCLMWKWGLKFVYLSLEMIQYLCPE